MRLLNSSIQVNVHLACRNVISDLVNTKRRYFEVSSLYMEKAKLCVPMVKEQGKFKFSKAKHNFLMMI